MVQTILVAVRAVAAETLTAVDAANHDRYLYIASDNFERWIQLRDSVVAERLRQGYRPYCRGCLAITFLVTSRFFKLARHAWDTIIAHWNPTQVTRHERVAAGVAVTCNPVFN